jgi:hypothetical protein
MTRQPLQLAPRPSRWWRDPDVLLPIVGGTTVLSVIGVVLVLILLVQSIRTGTEQQQVVVGDLQRLQECTVELLLIPAEQRTADVAEQLCPPLPSLAQLLRPPATPVPTLTAPAAPDSAPAGDPAEPPQPPASAPPPPAPPPPPASPPPPPAAAPPAPAPPPEPEPGPVDQVLEDVCAILPLTC